MNQPSNIVIERIKVREVTGVIEAGNPAEAAIDAAKAGFGITRVLSYQAAEDVARGSLLRVLPAYEGDDVPIHLVYPGGRHPPPKLRAFLDFTMPRLRRRCGAIERAIYS